MKHLGETVGVMTVQNYNNPLCYDQTDMKVMVAVADQVALAIQRKQAEKALKESEVRFNKLLQEIPSVAVQGYKLDGTTHFWNQASERLYGYNAHEAIGRNLLDLIIPLEMKGDVKQAMQGMTETGTHIPASELSLMRKDGSRVTVFSSHALVEIPGREPELFCIDIDLTERKLAEQKLRESEEKFRSLSESSPDYIMRYDRDCRHTYMNPAALAASGLTKADIISKTHRESGFPEDLSKLREEKIVQVFETGTPSQEEFSRESANGQVYLDWRLTPEFDAEKQVISVLVVSRDITERKQAEERLKELEERFRLTFYTIPDSVNINKMDGTYVDINDGYTQLTGYTKKDVIGKTAADINIWEKQEDRERLLKGLQKDGYVRNLESRFILKDGSYKTALMSAAIIKLKGEPHILSITRDITDFRKAEHDKLILEKQLQQAQKMESVGRLAGGVAHDFNNMLGVILGHAELAMEQLDRDQPIFNNLQQILQAANRSTDITKQLLAFARKQIISPKVIDLNETVTGMLNMLLRLIEEDIDLAWIPGKLLWPIKIDPSQIDQILVNLCVNARDAIADVGKITVETENCSLDEEYCSAHAGFVCGEYVKIVVSDNGSGMDKETASNIFEPFFTTKGVNEGTGLGLATVYGIVKQNNGFVYVYSEQGQGTTFSIYFPRYIGKNDTEESDITAEPAIRGSETILLVEDEPTILNMTTTILQRLGYTVLAVGTPSEAIRLAGEHSGEIDLVLTDVIMPEMNGRMLTENLMVNRPGLKCLFMSGYTANVISHHGVLDDGVNFMQKPFSKSELAAKIWSALGNG